MNKITTTAGLIALGAASVQAAVYGPPPGSPGATKPWSVSATLRGFYDDNYGTAPNRSRLDPSGARKRDSFGFEVSPSAGVNLIRDQTAIGLNYTYSGRWFEDREDNEWDHAHQVNAKLSHAFTPRYKADITDSFVIAQEPQLLDPSGQTTVPVRTEGDNLRNHVNTSFTAGVTETTDVVLGYSNLFYDYEQDGPDSYSSYLDRVEHRASVNLRQVLLERTVGVLGYQFQAVDYTSEDTFFGFDPEIRNSHSHYFYLGVDQGITPTLNLSARGGIQYKKFTEIDDALPGTDDDEWSPYVDINATWTFLEGSYAQLGARHERTETDLPVVLNGTGSPLSPDAESTMIYGSVSHRFMGSFVASALGAAQRSRHESLGGSEVDEDYFTAGVNLTYEINRWVAAEVGYNWDRLDSEAYKTTVARSYTRNRVYVGVRATY